MYIYLLFLTLCFLLLSLRRWTEASDLFANRRNVMGAIALTESFVWMGVAGLCAIVAVT
jgi:hypothetical protein